MKYEMKNIEASEVKNVAETTAVKEAAGAEAAEQKLMDAAAEFSVSEQEQMEQAEMDEGAEKLGYSSSYYEHEMERALANGNEIAYKNAKNNWAKAKVRETT